MSSFQSAAVDCSKAKHTKNDFYIRYNTASD